MTLRPPFEGKRQWRSPELDAVKNAAAMKHLGEADVRIL
jgi:hypothetical protein